MDFNRAMLLLSVAEKAVQWPELKFLHDAAMSELRKLASPSPKAIPTPNVPISERVPQPTERKI